MSKRPDPRTEHQIQCAFIQRVRLHENRWPELKTSYAVPNGQLRNARVAMKLKREGVRPAVPDWVLPVAKSGFSALYIEFKSRRPDGQKYYPGPAQREMHEELQRWGNRVEVCWDDGEAWEIVKQYLHGLD